MLRRRRWLGFTLLAVFFVVLFVRLSFWQWSRLHERRAANAVVRAHLSAPPIQLPDLDQLAATDPELASQQEWREVQVSGRWDAAHQLLVRNRPFDGNAGYEVVTPLVPASGPVLLVDRGWVTAGRTPAGPDAYPTPQAGIVSVTARLRPAEPVRPAEGLPAGQTLSIATPAIAGQVPYPLIGGYAVLVSEDPRQPGAPQALPGPALDDGPHLSYAIQWLLFAAVAIGGWWTFLKREAEEADEAQQTAKAPPGVVIETVSEGEPSEPRSAMP
jgi:cytochrome oxidase assembly protein ShyY1